MAKKEPSTADIFAALEGMLAPDHPMRRAMNATRKENGFEPLLKEPTGPFKPMKIKVVDHTGPVGSKPVESEFEI